MKIVSGLDGSLIEAEGVSILEYVGHFFENFRTDLELISQMGLKHLRVSIPWSFIESEQGNYRFRELDSYLKYCHELGFTVIADIVHHNNVPLWMKASYLDDCFVPSLIRFLEKFRKRYPWIEWYTVINEPTATSALCEDIWRPRATGLRYRIMRQMAKAICLSKELGIRHYFTEPCIHHAALSSRNQEQVEFLNQQRFFFLDLVQGLVDESHPLFFHLIEEEGYVLEDIEWFNKYSIKIDRLVLSYYIHNEILVGDIDSNIPPARGLRQVVEDYIYNYMGNIETFALGETNVRGRAKDRLSWFKYALEQCEMLETEWRDLWDSMAWFPILDTVSWDNLVQRVTPDEAKRVDCQGVIFLNQKMRRYQTEFTRWFASVCSGQATSNDLPAYQFDVKMHNYPLRHLNQMSHWRWVS